jgi:hypothetical protein
MQIVDNFLYFNDYQTLKTAFDLCNVYEANWT